MKTWKIILCYPFILIMILLVLGNIFFPPDSKAWTQGLPFGEIHWNEDRLEFKPELPKNPKRYIEVPLPELAMAETLEDGTDLNRLAYAVALAETHDCKKGSGKVNNCFGIIRRGKFQKYDKPSDSYDDFKQIWKKYYQKYPNYYLAHKYTGGDSVEDWMVAVNQYYYE